jgi:hypothetical protein
LAELPWDKRLLKGLHHPATEICLIVLLIADVCFVITDILLEIRVCEIGRTTAQGHYLEHVQFILKWCSLSILFVFCVEVLLLLVALRAQFFRHVLYVLDLAVLPTAIALDLTIGHLEVDPASLLPGSAYLTQLCLG